MKINLKITLTIAFAVSTVSCASNNLSPQEYSELAETTVVFSKYGQPPNSNYNHSGPANTLNGYKSHIQSIGKKIEDHIEKKCSKRKERAQVTIFIHGGLNDKKEALERARKHVSAMKENCIYPIFISWNSSLWSSWGDHVFNIRKGEYESGILSKAKFPFIFLSDAIRGFVRLPVDLLNAANLAFTKKPKTAVSIGFDDCKSQLLKANNQLDDENNVCKPVDTVVGNIPADSYREGWKPIARGFKRSPLFISNVLTLPIVNTFGKSSWRVMEGRIQRLFQSKGGATSPLLMLMEEVKRASNGNTDITLIGHSMGAIVVNGILRNMNDFPIDTIVYMAAASSLKEFEESVYPYMKINTNTKVYHLVLDPDIERHEVNFYNGFIPAPQGSLLLWIDDYLSEPRTASDRTSGRYDNLVPFLNDNRHFEQNRNMKLVIFAAGDELRRFNPMKHGEFSSFPFWSRKFYDQAIRRTGITRLCSDSSDSC